MTELPSPAGSAPQDIDTLITVKEAAKLLRMCEKSLRAKAKAGEIPCVYFGGKSMRFHPRTLLKTFNPKDL
jgi:excisionase family DNA binding protein